MAKRKKKLNKAEQMGETFNPYFEKLLGLPPGDEWAQRLEKERQAEMAKKGLPPESELDSSTWPEPSEDEVLKDRPEDVITELEDPYQSVGEMGWWGDDDTRPAKGIDPGDERRLRELVAKLESAGDSMGKTNRQRYGREVGDATTMSSYPPIPGRKVAPGQLSPEDRATLMMKGRRR